MDRTTFLGLTALEPGDALESDGASFLYRNIHTLDHVGQVGAVTHRHDEHVALANPSAAVGLTANTSSGSIGNDVTLYVGYTLIDEYGGETLVSPLASASTPASLDDPSSSPTVTFDDSGGSLIAGTYYYIVTIVDALGGETLSSEYGFDTRLIGPASGQMVISGLDDLVAEVAGGVSWRMYRSFNGGGWGLLTTGSTPTFTDDGSLCADETIIPPDVNSTGGTNSFTVIVPAQGSAAAAVRLYAGQTDELTSPAYVGAYAASGAAVLIADLNFDNGSPPPVSLAFPGAHRIDAETELDNHYWRSPVANEAALPTSGNQTGDARLAIAEGTAHYWDGADWQDLAGGGGGSYVWYGPPIIGYHASGGIWPLTDYGLLDPAPPDDPEQQFGAVITMDPPGIFLYDPWSEIWRRQDQAPSMRVESWKFHDEVGVFDDWTPHGLGSAAWNSAGDLVGWASGAYHRLETIDGVPGAQQSLMVSARARVAAAGSASLAPSGMVGVAGSVSYGTDISLQAEYDLASRTLTVGLADILGGDYQTGYPYIESVSSGGLEPPVGNNQNRYITLRVVGDRAIAIVSSQAPEVHHASNPGVIGALSFEIPMEYVNLLPNAYENKGNYVAVFYRTGLTTNAFVVNLFDVHP